jgi:hypothetical protein
VHFGREKNGVPDFDQVRRSLVVLFLIDKSSDLLFNFISVGKTSVSAGGG